MYPQDVVNMVLTTMFEENNSKHGQEDFPHVDNKKRNNSSCKLESLSHRSVPGPHIPRLIDLALTGKS